MKWLALLLILLLVPSTLAASVTVDIFGTNVSNAQSNLTKTGNNSYQVVQWQVGDTTKSLKADINGNASDSINFTLHNFTAYRVVEVKVNSSAFNSYKADSTGTISFTRTQTVKNQTYSFSPAINAGGYNFTWMQLWTFPSLFGLNFTNYFLPYTGATADLDMNNKNITNVQTMNVTTTNVTLLNATDIQGNGSGISALNASNLTIGTIPSGRYATGIYVANISDLTSQNFVTNETMNFYSGNASNLTTGVLPNASIPASAMNVSSSRIKFIPYTRNASVSGVQLLEGVGFIPVYVYIIVAMSGKDSISWGHYDGTTTGSTYQNSNASWGGSANLIQVFNGSLEQHATVNGFTNDGVNITWAGDNPVGTINLDVTFYR